MIIRTGVNGLHVISHVEVDHKPVHGKLLDKHGMGELNAQLMLLKISKLATKSNVQVEKIVCRS